MNRTRNSEPRTTSTTTTLKAWVRMPFGLRGERTRPTRPYIGHGHEAVRFQPPPLV